MDIMSRHLRFKRRVVGNRGHVRNGNEWRDSLEQHVVLLRRHQLFGWALDRAHRILAVLMAFLMVPFDARHELLRVVGSRGDARVARWHCSPIPDSTGTGKGAMVARSELHNERCFNRIGWAVECNSVGAA